MLHTIHADFYRLFRSKGFWISEIILALNIISGVLLGGTGHVGVETGAKQAVKSASSWTGVGSLINYSSSISMTVLFTLIVVSIILGVDLAQKLYKNNLTSGISRSGFFFRQGNRHCSYHFRTTPPVLRPCLCSRYSLPRSWNCT